MTEIAESKAIGVGMIIAAGIVMSCWGMSVIATEILGAAGIFSMKDLIESGVDEYDINLLKDLFDEA